MGLTLPEPDFTIVPIGPFSLEEATNFGFGQRESEAFEDVMRLAFCVDGYRQQVGVALRQDGAGVHGWVEGDANLATCAPSWLACCHSTTTAKRSSRSAGATQWSGAFKRCPSGSGRLCFYLP